MHSASSGRHAATKHGAIHPKFPHHHFCPNYHMRNPPMVHNRSSPHRNHLHIDPPLLSEGRQGYETHREHIPVPLVLSYISHGSRAFNNTCLQQE